MKHIVLDIELRDDNTVKSITFDENDTEFESSPLLIKHIGVAFIKSGDLLIKEEQIINEVTNIINNT